MNPTDAFAVLGLPITASEADVKAAYRRLVGRYHPDTGTESGPEAADAMRRINAAYAVARATWHRTASRASKPIYDPPKPPPRAVPQEPAAPAGPEVPPLHVESQRVQAAAAEVAERVRRHALMEGLEAIAFIAEAGDERRAHAVVDAFAPVIADGESLRACVTCDRVDHEGVAVPPLRTHRFAHAVPSPGHGDGRPRADAIARIVPCSVVAVTDLQLLWSTSRLDDDGGLLLDETIDVHGLPLAEIRVARVLPSGFEVILARGAALTFRVGAEAAEQLAATVLAEPAR